MEQNRKKQAGIVITAITKLLKEFNFGLEIYKDGSFVLTDAEIRGAYKISAEDLQKIYEED